MEEEWNERQWRKGKKENEAGEMKGRKELLRTRKTYEKDKEIWEKSLLFD